MNEVDCSDAFHNLQCSYDQNSGIETIGFTTNPTFASVNSTALYSQVCTCGNLQVGSNGTVLIRVIDPNNNAVASPNPILTQGNITFSTTPTYSSVTVTNNTNVGGNLAVTGGATAATLASTGNTNVGGNLAVTGNATANVGTFPTAFASYLSVGTPLPATALGSGQLLAVSDGSNQWSDLSAMRISRISKAFLLNSNNTEIGDFASSVVPSSLSNYTFEKIGYRSLMRTSASGTLSDAVAISGEAEIYYGNTMGRAWGGFFTCTVDSTADGYCNALEIGVGNNGANTPGTNLPAGAYSKTALRIWAFGSAPNSAGIAIGNDGSTFYRGLAIQSSVVSGNLSSDPLSSAICLWNDGTTAFYKVDANGYTGIGSLTSAVPTPLFVNSNAASYRGASNVAASFATSSTTPPVVVGSLSGTELYVGAGLSSSNSSAVLSLMTNGQRMFRLYSGTTGCHWYIDANNNMGTECDVGGVSNTLLYSSGSGSSIVFKPGGLNGLSMFATPNAVNYVALNLAVTGQASGFTAAGTDANIDFKIVPKGSGVLSVPAGITATGVLSGQVATPTPRSLISKLQDVVSVKDYGALGNGVADDTSAIQTAINTCASTTVGQMCTVTFPEGVYLFTALTLPGYIALRGTDMYSTVLRAKSGGNGDFCIATNTYATNVSTSVDYPVHFFDITLDGQNLCSSTLVLRTFYPILNRVQVCGGLAQNLYVTTVTLNGGTLTPGLSSVNGRITNSNFGSMACSTTSASYDVLINDPNAQVTDWFVEGNFFTGNTAHTSISNIGGMQTAAGWIIRGNHFYNLASTSSYNIVIRGADFGTVIANNVFENSVQINAGTGASANVTGARFGPGNVLYTGVLMASFGSFGKNIISVANSYIKGYIQHDFFAPDRVLTSMSDSFFNYQPYRWTSASSTGVIVAANSWNGYTANVMDFVATGATTLQTTGVPFSYKMGTYGVNNAQLTYTARAQVTASSNSLNFSLTAPTIPAGGSTGYHIKALCTARTNIVSTVQVNYMMDGLVIESVGGAFGFTVASEVITPAQFTVTPSYSVTAISSALISITMTATFANVVSNTAYGECILEAL